MQTTEPAGAHDAREARRPTRRCAASRAGDVERREPVAEKRLQTGNGKRKHRGSHFAVLDRECRVVVPCTIKVNPAATDDEVETGNGNRNNAAECVSF